MTDIILALAVILIFIFVFFTLKKLELFLDKNRRIVDREPEDDDEEVVIAAKFPKKKKALGLVAFSVLISNC